MRADSLGVHVAALTRYLAVLGGRSGVSEGLQNRCLTQGRWERGKEQQAAEFILWNSKQAGPGNSAYVGVKIGLKGATQTVLIVPHGDPEFLS